MHKWSGGLSRICIHEKAVNIFPQGNNASAVLTIQWRAVYNTNYKTRITRMQYLYLIRVIRESNSCYHFLSHFILNITLVTKNVSIPTVLNYPEIINKPAIPKI